MLFGQRPNDCRIEPRRLRGPEDFSHGEDVGERVLLQFAHRDVRLIHGGGNLRSGVVLLGNRFCQPRVVTSQFQLARASARGKAQFKLFQRRALIGIEIETLVHELMEVDRRRDRRWQKCAPDCDTSEAGKQGNRGNGQRLAKPQADHAPNSVDKA